jgi:hypothetical protein
MSDASRLESLLVSRRDYVLASVVAVLVASIYFVLNGGFELPILHGDEGGYLGNARRVADAVGVSRHGYLAGYSLFLVPAAIATTDPWVFHSLALDTNALMAGATAGIMVLISRTLFPELSELKAVVAAVLAMLVTGVAVFPFYAMSESVLVPAISGSSLLLILAARCEAPVQRRVLLAAFSFLCAFSAWANVRGLALVFAGVAISVVLLFVIDAWQPTDLLVVLGVVGVGLVLGDVVNDAIVGSVSSAPGSDTSGYLDAIRDVGQWPRVGLNIVRRIGYLTVASAGMIWAVVVWLVKQRRSRWVPSDDGSIVVAVLFVLFALGLSLVLNSLTMGLLSSSRTDQLFYGRYIEIYLPVLVVVAVGLVASRLSSSEMRIVALLSLVSSIIAAAALSIESTRQFDAPVNAIAIYTIAVFVDLNLVVAFGVGGIFSALAWLVMSMRLRIGLVYAGAALAVLAMTAYFSVLLPPQQWRDAQVAIPLALLELQQEEQLECIAVHAIEDAWHQIHLYEFVVPGTVVERSPNSDCAVRVGSALQYVAAEDAIRLAYEPALDLYLWRVTDSVG